MVKIIFSDFDNTMMNYYSDKNYFNDYQISILKKVKERGIKFCLVTGRSISFFEQFSNLLGVVDYIIGSNGAVVYDVKNREFIYHKNIKKEVLKNLIDYAVKNNYSFILNCLDKRYQYGEWKYVSGEKFDSHEEYDSEQMILSFKKINGDNISNFMQYLDHIIVNNTTDWGDEFSIDITDSSVSKGNTVLWLCSNLEIDREDAIAFGDGNNDLSMFEVVGKSVAVDNAQDNIKNMADEVTLKCSEDGIYKYIEKNILK